MANPQKGEIDLEFAGKNYTCRLTIDSILRIEDELDCSIIELALDISNVKGRLKHLAAVLYYGLRNGGNDVSRKDVNKIIEESGIVITSTNVANLLSFALSDPKERSVGKPQKT
tara:strand:+ start:318 stop:659 length:342 start_codon:yes stop_codon:yes gene_type:complete